MEILIFLTNLEFDIIIDGILGTGISGEIREPQASAITFINKSNTFKLAVDVPSGVDPDTGNKNLPHVSADMTVTFHRMKVGMPKRTDVCGEIFVEKIGIPPEARDWCSMKVYQIPVGPMQNFSYIVEDESTHEAIVIDPSWDLEKITEIINEQNLNPKYIVNTHWHDDHTRGNEELAKELSVKIVQHDASDSKK